MKKKIALILTVVVLAALAIGGTTYALFTDSASNTGNTFASGTVDIDSYRDGFDTIPGPMFYTTAEEGATPTDPSYLGLKPTGIWAPGDKHVRSLIVFNQGTLDAALDSISAEILRDEQNLNSQMNVAVYKIAPPPEVYVPDVPGDDSLPEDVLRDLGLQVANILITFGDVLFGVEDMVQAAIEARVDAEPTLLWRGTLAELIADEQSLLETVNLMANDEPLAKRGALLAFAVQMDINAGNEYQNAEAAFGFTVGASQARNVD